MECYCEYHYITMFIKRVMLRAFSINAVALIITKATMLRIRDDYSNGNIISNKE